MNYIIKKLTVFLSLGIMACANVSAMDLVAPPQETIRLTDVSIKETGAILRAKKIDDFYKYVGGVFKRINEPAVTKAETLAGLENKLWFIYYIAVAPLLVSAYSLDVDNNDALMHEKDITYKEFAVIELACMLNAAVDKDVVFKKNIDTLAMLSCQYATKILLDLRRGYIPNLEIKMEEMQKKKEKEIVVAYKSKRAQLDMPNEQQNNSGNSEVVSTKEHDKDIRELNRNQRIIANKVIDAINRNDFMANSIGVVEKNVLKILLHYYPNKPQEVFRYLKLAGYTKEEIPSLLNRTVGRNPKTEFLFPDAKKQ